VNGINNPCPIGFRIPTITEWDTERGSWSGYTATGAFNSSLKLPMAGYRVNDAVGNTINGYVESGTRGYYWSSTISGSDVWRLAFASGPAVNYTINRSEGQSVRCIKD
jgi:uncharacterized protein (TIGR02145 family)